MKYDTSKYEENRKKFELTTQQIQEISCKIEQTVLTEEDMKIIDKAILTCHVTDYKRRKDGASIKRDEIIRLAYIMRYKLQIPLIHMSSYLNMNESTFFKKMQALGWNYTTYEAQQLAANVSRDYSQIRIKAKQTMLTSINCSPLEDKVREYINLKLSELLPNFDIIVGCNNLSILSDINMEVDIPVLIFTKKRLYKFAIEFNGYYWHEVIERKDEEKKKALINKGYKYYEIWQCSTNEQKEEKGFSDVTVDIDKVIKDIIKSIK